MDFPNFTKLYTICDIDSAYYHSQKAEWLAVLPQGQINSSAKQILKEIQSLNLDDSDLPKPPPVDKQTFIQLTELSLTMVITNR